MEKTLVEQVEEFLQRYGERAVIEAISDDTVLSRAGQINRARGGGHPRRLRTCPNGCGYVGGAREMRRHLPGCPKRGAP